VDFEHAKIFEHHFFLGQSLLLSTTVLNDKCLPLEIHFCYTLTFVILADAVYFNMIPHTYTYIGYPQGYGSPDK